MIISYANWRNSMACAHGMQHMLMGTSSTQHTRTPGFLSRLKTLNAAHTRYPHLSTITSCQNLTLHAESSLAKVLLHRARLQAIRLRRPAHPLRQALTGAPGSPQWPRGTPVSGTQRPIHGRRTPTAPACRSVRSLHDQMSRKHASSWRYQAFQNCHCRTGHAAWQGHNNPLLTAEAREVPMQEFACVPHLRATPVRSQLADAGWRDIRVVVRAHYHSCVRPPRPDMRKTATQMLLPRPQHLSGHTPSRQHMVLQLLGNQGVLSSSRPNVACMHACALCRSPGEARDVCVGL